MYSTYNERKSVVAESIEFQNMKIFLLKDTLQNGQKKFSLLAKLKIQFLGLMLLVT